MMRFFTSLTATILTLLIHGSKSSSPHKKRIPFVYSAKEEQPLNHWAREAIAKGEAKFKDVKPVVVDPNSNADTNNQRSIFIASEFLNHASPEFMGNGKVSGDQDRLVKVGRSLVDLVDLTASDNESEESNEELLKLGLANIVEQCDILAKDDLKVSNENCIISA